MKQANALNRASFFDGKAFGIIALIYAVIGLLLLGHHIGSYDAILLPQLDYLIENNIHTNTIGGWNFLSYFTNQANIFVFVYLILFAIGNFGNKKLFSFTRNDFLRGAVVLYIAVTGIIYCGVILPFATATYPMEKGIWFSNVVNYWLHLITPVAVVLFWFKPLSTKKISAVKAGLTYLIYPIAYFIFSAIRGSIIGFYPYPFLSAVQMWGFFFSDKEYNVVAAYGLLILAIAILLVVFFGLSILLVFIHNKLVAKSAPSESEADAAAAVVS